MSFDPSLFAGESQVLEYKAAFDKAAVESLVAFANTKGGSVLVGVKDICAQQLIDAITQRGVISLDNHSDRNGVKA